MMKITPFDKIICRTPAFGFNQTLAEVWEQLKLKIEESSPNFYELIKNLNHVDLKTLDEKSRFTIWKYLNRAKFRATPFGTFAAISLMELSFAADTKPIITQELIARHWIDWSLKEVFNSTAMQDVKQLHSNSSIYFVGNEIRYLKTAGNSFELAAVDSLPELNVILLTCKRKTSPAEIYELMERSFDLGKAATLALLTQLIELQLLQTNLQPNITGADYFEKLGITCLPKPSNYIIAERAIVKGNFNGKLLKQLPELLSFYTKHLAAPVPADLSTFIHHFSKRFDQQEPTLALVMDPEIGIGYGDLAQLQPDELVNGIKDGQAKPEPQSLSYGKLQQFLLRGMMMQQAIDLSNFEEAATQNAVLPNTFSLIFHLYNGQAVLAHTGGSTANALLGRFTLGNEKLTAYGSQIATLETEANTDVLFFDIAYQAEKKVDNVNRRAKLYTYELPILTWSETDQPLTLTDIVVAVADGEVILKSKSLGKRIVPKIPSAYNYSRSDLAVFRFLCDVQNQGILSNFSFKLQDLFPNLAHYPRVTFKSIIVSPAMWLIPAAAMKELINLQKWLKAQDFEVMLKVGYADQSLCIDPNNEQDVWALWHYCKQQKDDVYLTEALLADSDLLKDEKGNSYHPQYIVNYYHQERVYEPSKPIVVEQPECCLPGSEWLYVEIYSHFSKSNYLLTGLISHFLKTNHSYLKKWFFIRYTDPAPHIRFRVELKNKTYGFMLLDSLQQLISIEMTKGFVSDFKLPTYQKETQRYGASRMHLVEHFFMADSRYVSYLIKKSTTEQLLMNALQAAQTLAAMALNELTDQIKFVESLAQSFAKEMNMNSVAFKNINANFNVLKPNIGDTLKIPAKIDRNWRLSFKAIMDVCDDNYSKHKMLADLIHMHVNRLFITDQRVYEAIIYQYWKRLLYTKQALLKVGQG